MGVTCQDKEAERALNHFLRTVPVGWNQKGIQAFLDSYLDCLLTCGRAVGEIVPSRDGRDIAAVLCGRVSDVQVKEGDSPLEVLLALRRPDGRTEVLPRQELLLFTPYHPSPEHPYGVSLLHSPAFLSGVLLKIYQTLGANWERAAMSALPWCTSRGKRRWTTGGCRREASCWPSGGQRPWRAPGPGLCGTLWRWGMWRSRSLARSAPSPTARHRCG